MSASNGPLPLPPFFDPANARNWNYAPDLPQIAQLSPGWVDRFDVSLESRSARRVELLVVDAQKDFCLPEGALFVGGRSGTGAVDDNVRLAKFIYRNLASISGITLTQDSHNPYQIFFPSFWLGRDGQHLADYTVVTSEMVESGRARPDPALARLLSNGDYESLVRHAAYYCRELERKGKYQLVLWPFHCVLGTDGHALAGVVSEACLFHSLATRTQMSIEEKGAHPLTENYSAISPEITHTEDGKPIALRNDRLMDRLRAADAIIVAGQAASHCVRWTISDIASELVREDPSAASRIYILRDCTSAVAVPDGLGGFVADYTEDARSAFAQFEQEGMHLVDSSSLIANWA